MLAQSSESSIIQLLYIIYRGRQSVKHFPITLTESGIIMGSKLFQTVPLLMEHFHSVPVLVDESGKAHIQ